MIRIPPERGQSSRMEVRLGDATANPYLAMAAVSAAVYLGVRDKLVPPAPLEGYGYDPESAPMLPQSLPEALDALEADAELREVLGDFFVTRSSPTSATRSSASAGTSPTGSSWSTPTTCERCSVDRRDHHAATTPTHRPDRSNEDPR